MVETLLTSSGLQIMEVVVQGLRRKEKYLQDRIAWELNRYRDDERAEIRRQVITTGEEMKMEANGVKKKKRERDIAERTRKFREEEEEEDWVVRLQAGDVQAREEAVEGEEEVVPDSWEERFQEGENVFDFGRRIFDSDDSIKSRDEELKMLEMVLRNEGLKVGEKVDFDGNCFYRSVAREMQVRHEDVRREAVKTLRNTLEEVDGWKNFGEGDDRAARVSCGKIRWTESGQEM
jgi:hypothetical protein